MKESNIILAQKEIDDALKTVDEIVAVIDKNEHKTVLKEKFSLLTEKVQEVEHILKEEGII
ncbi:hypothetical protein [Clostridium sp.]|uniref:hypothetical protein n=1 Tax=Clostridium sp. TaxID=1506 RepID=UPI0026187DCB|nr:hypothetical protein [Clostridium sp.]